MSIRRSSTPTERCEASESAASSFASSEEDNNHDDGENDEEEDGDPNGSFRNKRCLHVTLRVVTTTYFTTRN
mgnify:FL=1